MASERKEPSWLWDLIAGGGLVLIVVGLWWLSPAIALIVLGLALVAVGVGGGINAAIAEASATQQPEAKTDQAESTYERRGIEFLGGDDGKPVVLDKRGNETRRTK
jgi:hypothetical protein